MSSPTAAAVEQPLVVITPKEKETTEVEMEENINLDDEDAQPEVNFDHIEKPKPILYQPPSYAKKKSVAQRMMDIALLTSNANQLRYVMAFGVGTHYYYVSVVLISLSLALQMVVGVFMVIYSKPRTRVDKEFGNNIVVSGVLLITIVNVLITAFTIEGDAGRH